MIIAGGGIYLWGHLRPPAAKPQQPDRQECEWASGDFRLWVMKKSMEYHRTESELNADIARCQASGLMDQSGGLIQ